jgi:CheY-like chemotaxis protein
VPIPDPDIRQRQTEAQIVRPKVLICDDENALRALVRGALSIGDYELAEARDGDESVEIAMEFEPDLIVLDVMMPGRTGFEVLEELRTDTRFAETPVVLLTARTQAADREAADSAGADRFLPKPFSPLELVSIVEELLGQQSAA